MSRWTNEMCSFYKSVTGTTRNWLILFKRSWQGIITFSHILAGNHAEIQQYQLKLLFATPWWHEKHFRMLPGKTLELKIRRKLRDRESDALFTLYKFHYFSLFQLHSWYCWWLLHFSPLSFHKQIICETLGKHEVACYWGQIKCLN
jgi:hypothetical protein